MNKPEYILGKEMVVDLSEVYPNDWNPKDSIEDNETNKAAYEEIKTELKNKGQFEAITVRERNNGNGGKYQILDGFHRWFATKELERPKIKINNLGVVDNQLARAITVIKEQKKVPVSEMKIADIVLELSKEGLDNGQLGDLFGLNDEKLQDYIKLSDFDWDGLGDSKPKEDKNEEAVSPEVECPECGAKFSPWAGHSQGIS